MIEQEKPVCGFIGLGSQGAPIARRMIGAGYPMVLWARRSETLDAFGELSAQHAVGIAELGSRVNYVGICVTDDAAVFAVCQELIASLRAGSTMALHSTVLPDMCKQVARFAASREIVFIEAPVSGGAPAAEAGKLTLMIGGEAEALERVRPIFETFADLILHLGGIGAGQTAKLINNTLMAANLGLAHCAVSSGIRYGLDRAALCKLLVASSGRSFALEVYARKSDPESISHSASLLEKVRLLGVVTGAEDPMYLALRDAATMIGRR